MKKQIVFATSSIYKKKLLNRIIDDFICEDSQVYESPLIDESPENLALRLAKEKALALTSKYPAHIIIGADQVAALDTKQLTKPGNRDNAIKQLTASSGNKVDFYTAVSVIDSANMQQLSDIDKCTVYFRNLSTEQIEHYVDIEKPYDCAGSFKAECLGIVLFERIEADDPNALIGLPLIRLITILKQFNLFPI